jgi:UDP-N-acetylglucosamine acyltransferase
LSQGAAHIHPTALVDSSAVLEDGVSVGAYSIIGADVHVGARTEIGPHVTLKGPTRLGVDNHVYQFNSIGDDPQDKKFAGEQTRLEIGDRNVIREFCTLNRGTEQGGGVTKIGDDNWIMAYAHVAHDCQIGSRIIMANGTTLAGHVMVGDQVTFGAFTIVHQFCAIGAHAFSAMGSVVLQDVPPYVTISGNSASPHGINAEGLKRRGYSSETIRAIRRAYKTVYKQGLTLQDALAEIRKQIQTTPELELFVDFCAQASRGIVR